MRRPALAVLALLAVTLGLLTACSNEPVVDEAATLAEPAQISTPTSAPPSPATPGEKFVADVLDYPGLSTDMDDVTLIGLGQGACDVMAYQEYTRDQLVAELGVSRLGPEVMGVIVDAAQRNICPQYSFPSATAAAVVPPAPVEPQMTVSQENALSKAESYLDFTAFSRTGLIKQLEFDQFSTDDATFAVDTVTVDWMVQAEKKAQSYLDFTSFSRSGLVDQLEFDGFTSEQAEHGANSVGL
ncbi:MAG: Ltp family lipoprotein [Pseudonocardia sp.]|nr:Ltp family lipoprotein [Pseudonocardia sp.]